MTLSEDAALNRAYWDRDSDEYQARHAEQLNTRPCAWGLWAIPEDELRVLGDVEGKDVLELGCGAAQWSIFLAKRGARAVALDNSARQLEHARQLMQAAGVEFPLVHASAEAVPYPDASFDMVFCDHGAMSFLDPALTLPEVARLLRPGGLLAFNMTSILAYLSTNPETDRLEAGLFRDYFGSRRVEYDDSIDFQLPYGEWIRLFRQHGLEVEDLIEIRPPEDAISTYGYDHDWARRWPAESLWKVRKRG